MMAAGAGNANLSMCYHVLQSLRYRNINQHRRSTWWKWVSITLRSLQKLLKDIDQVKIAAAREAAAYVVARIVPKAFLCVLFP